MSPIIKCIGCPFSVPTFEWNKGLLAEPVIRKCQFCFDRLAEGMEPACVKACPTDALQYGDRAVLLAEAHTRIRRHPDRCKRRRRCDARSQPPELREALDAWLTAGLPCSAALSELPTQFVAGGSGCVEALARRTDTETHALQFMLETALSPYLEKAASGFREQLSRTAWRRGVCPICGSEPYMARLAQEDGRRLLACRLCHTEWSFPRLACPFCTSGTPGTLTYFQIEGDDAHRVDCCPACRRYIKTTDERVVGRPAVLPIEDIVTAHLDDLAEEQRYS